MTPPHWFKQFIWLSTAFSRPEFHNLSFARSPFNFSRQPPRRSLPATPAPHQPVLYFHLSWAFWRTKASTLWRPGPSSTRIPTAANLRTALHSVATLYQPQLQDNLPLLHKILLSCHLLPSHPATLHSFLSSIGVPSQLNRHPPAHRQALIYQYLVVCLRFYRAYLLSSKCSRPAAISRSRATFWVKLLVVRHLFWKQTFDNEPIICLPAQHMHCASYIVSSPYFFYFSLCTQHDDKLHACDRFS